jgi:hypothetical protein
VKSVTSGTLTEGQVSRKISRQVGRGKARTSQKAAIPLAKSLIFAVLVTRCDHPQSPGTSSTMDPVELETVLAELARPLLRYCLGRTGDLGLAEEAAQEALVALVSRWRNWGAPESPAAFAFAIARRKAWRLVLRRRLSLPLTLLLGTAAPEPDPEAPG